MESEHIIIHKFENLNDALNYVFQFEKTSLLSFDRICEVLKNENLYYVSKKQGIMPCSTISRRRISFVLSTSEQFVRTGSERTCMWALKPHNEHYLSDSTIRGFIEQVLSSNGPMTIDQISNCSGLSSTDKSIYQRFFTNNAHNFTLSNAGTYWFANQPYPHQKIFENINQALVYAMNEFPNGASIEEVQWFLCLSTINGAKSITRRIISRELSRRPDVFLHVSRARYILNKNADLAAAEAENAQTGVNEKILNSEINDNFVDDDQNEDFFDPATFFNNDLFDFEMK